MTATSKEVEILLVEDNPTDADLAIRALNKADLANKLFWVKDGAEALDRYWLPMNHPPLAES